MKKVIGWILGTVFTAFGLGCVTFTREVMAQYYWYTWCPPYTN